MATVREDGSLGVVENCFVRKDGTRCWARVSHRALTDRHGQHTGGLAIMSDITASKAQAVGTAHERALRRGADRQHGRGHVRARTVTAAVTLHEPRRREAARLDQERARDPLDARHHPLPARGRLTLPGGGLPVARPRCAPARPCASRTTRSPAATAGCCRSSYSASPITIDDEIQGIVVVFGDVSAPPGRPAAPRAGAGDVDLGRSDP